VRFVSKAPATVSVTLQLKVHKKHSRITTTRSLRTWHYQLRAGVAIRKLYLPKGARHVGWYSLRWNVVSGTNTLRRTTGVQVVKSIHSVVGPRKKQVMVVMAGTSLPTGVKQAARLVAGSDSSAFDITADSRRNVKVVVVDADQYGLKLVHNLHLVFPMVRIIAVSSSPSKLALAKKAGATVALPKKAGTTKIVKVVAQLATVRLPQTARR
jgi:hypothetical protein